MPTTKSGDIDIGGKCLYGYVRLREGRAKPELYLQVKVDSKMMNGAKTQHGTAAWYTATAKIVEHMNAM
jgi:hypothetical protein